MCSCHSIPECCVMFSGVKLSMGSFALFIPTPQSNAGCKTLNHISGRRK